MIPLIKTALSSVKLWGAVSALVALTVFLRWGYSQVYDAGYSAAEVKWQAEMREAVQAAVVKAKKDWDLAAAIANTQIETEQEIVDRVRIVERRIPQVVERLVVPECTDLGADIQRVFNDAIRAGSDRRDESPGDPAVSDG